MKQNVALICAILQILGFFAIVFVCFSVSVVPWFIVGIGGIAAVIQPFFMDLESPFCGVYIGAAIAGVVLIVLAYFEISRVFTIGFLL
jgi:hypothetical protein